MSSDLKAVGMLISPKRKSIYYKYDSCKIYEKREKNNTKSHEYLSKNNTNR